MPHVTLGQKGRESIVLDTESIAANFAAGLKPRHCSRSVRLYFSGKGTSKSVLDFARDHLLLDMIDQAKKNYAIGFRADCVVMTERLPDDASLRLYSRNNLLRLSAELRDVPTRELVCHLLAQVLPHLAQTMALPVVMTEVSFEGATRTPLIRLSLV